MSSFAPSFLPSLGSSQIPTFAPTLSPTFAPTNPTFEPTFNPTFEPTFEPTFAPTSPTFEPTFSPTSPTFEPTFAPTSKPTYYDPLDGDAIWPRFRGDGQMNGASLYNGSVTSDLNWAFNTTAAFYSSPAIDKDDNIYMTCLDYHLYKITGKGSVIWKFRTGYLLGASPVIGKGQIYLSALDQYFYSITPQGTEIWKYKIGDYIVSTPAVDTRGTVYIGVLDKKFHALSPNAQNTAASMKWTFNTLEKVISSPSVSVDSEIVYVGCDDKNVYAIWTQTGSLYWKFTTASSVYSSISVHKVTGNLYFTSQDSFIYAVSSQGTKIWSYKTGAPLSASTAIGWNDVIYVGSDDSFLYALQASSGSLVWKSYFGNKIDNSAVVSRDGNIYVGSEDLCMVEPKQGSIIWKFSLKNTYNIIQAASSPAINSKGAIIVGTSEKAVYSIGYYTDKFISRRPTLSPTLAPIAPTQSPVKTESNSSTMIIIVVAAVGGFLFFAGLSLFFYFYSYKLKQEEAREYGDDWEKEGRNPLFGSIFKKGGSTNGWNSSKSAGKTKYVPKRRNSQAGLQIDWADIHVTGENAQEAIIGHGSFGTVIRATWSPNRVETSTTQDFDVAVKVLTRSAANITTSDFDQICDKAYEEVELIREAEKNMAFNDCIIHVYGVAEGPLPSRLTSIFHIERGEEGVGIVMRYEGGGSLDGLIHAKNGATKPNIPLTEKLRLMTGIARGLSELHSLGIVHADIKPANVLLSHHVPPEIRLADFGLSTLSSAGGDMGMSSLEQTKHLRGTPIYCAPEMLVNPFTEVFDDAVAKSSRKTDIYAFAQLCWEVLAQEKPFSEVKTEGMLCAKVHQGFRPSMEQIPKETPAGVVAMIEACWDKDRMRRKAAVECLSILEYNFGVLTETTFDIYFSHAIDSTNILSYVFHFLTQTGFRVWYNQNDSGDDLEREVSEGISKSKVVVACLNQSYQESSHSMFELRGTKESNPPKAVVTLVIEADLFNWANDDLIDLCQLRSNMFVNVGNLATDDWNSDEGPTAKMVDDLHKSLEPFLKLLNDLGCRPGGAGAD